MDEIEKHRETVQTVARKMSFSFRGYLSDFDEDDFYQEGILALWLYTRRGKKVNTSLAFTIAKNGIIDFIRKRWGKEGRADLPHPDPPITDSYEFGIDDLVALNFILKAPFLTDRERRFLFLYSFCNLNYREIGEITGTTRENANFAIRRARRKVREGDRERFLAA